MNLKPIYEDLQLRSSARSFYFFHVAEEELRPFWHYHPELELTLVYEGSGTRFVGDSILPYQPLDLVLIGENLPHHWVSVNTFENNPQKAVVIQFSKTLFDVFPECAIVNKLFDEAERGIQFLKPSQELVEHLIHFDEVSEMEQLSRLIAILSQLSKHLEKQFLSQTTYKQLGNKKEQNKIVKTTNYILEHLHQKLTIEQMAEITHLVPQSFCRWFKNATGNTFITYLNKVRIEKACQLLRNSQMSIANIALSVGFESLSHFNRTFLKQKGMSPSTFRKSIVA